MFICVRVATRSEGNGCWVTFWQHSFRRSDVEGGNKMGYFVPVDLLSVLGSPYSWTIKKSLKSLVRWECAEQGLVWRGEGGTRYPAGSGCELGCGSGAVEGVPLFPVCGRSHWLPQQHAWNPHLALHQAGGEEERVGLRTSGWSHCKSRHPVRAQRFPSYSEEYPKLVYFEAKGSPQVLFWRRWNMGEKKSSMK